MPEPEPTPSAPAPAAFGAAIRSVSADLARERGLPAAYGVEVGTVRPGSAAEAAGIVAGDVIVSIGVYTIQGGADQFRQAVAARSAGDTMSLAVWRDRRRLEVEVRF